MLVSELGIQLILNQFLDWFFSFMNVRETNVKTYIIILITGVEIITPTRNKNIIIFFIADEAYLVLPYWFRDKSIFSSQKYVYVGKGLPMNARID